MAGNLNLLEKYLRSLPVSQEDVTLTFAGIEEILERTHASLGTRRGPWWDNQRPGLRVETIPWMDAGWMVEVVDLMEKWVRFVRQ